MMCHLSMCSTLRIKFNKKKKKWVSLTLRINFSRPIDLYVHRLAWPIWFQYKFIHWCSIWVSIVQTKYKKSKRVQSIRRKRRYDDEKKENKNKRWRTRHTDIRMEMMFLIWRRRWRWNRGYNNNNDTVEKSTVERSRKRYR